MSEKVLELKNATLAYNKDYCALNQVCVAFESGEKVAIVGNYGSGKTSLLRIFAGLEKLKSGECLIKGREVAKVDFAQDISLGFLSSAPIFFENKTVLDNLCWTLKVRGIEKEKRPELANKVLLECGVENLSDKKAKHLNPVERRIVQIARLMLRPIDILLCDEVFDCFETDAQKQVKVVFDKLLKAPNEDKVVLFSCSTIEPYKTYVDKVYTMELGDIKQEEEGASNI